ncbi:MAG: peptidase [Rhodobacteraceae bacterium CG17_big_fil_post_rev_8_21_14_2_50_65_11]|nr:MAG: peptidase [Rhodobacteraceae bacterium CG17_big_fil_post_rev_8_21_14_2_50_65_11]
MTALFPDVIVNGETIAPAAIAAEAQNHSGPAGKPGIAWRKAAQALTIRALLLQEAARRGLQAQVQELAPGRIETEAEALIRTLLEEAVEMPEVTADQVRAEWARDPDRFRSAPLWDVAHILCECDPRDEAESAAARARAEALIARLDGDAKGFAALAARESDCGSKSAGGALGQLGPGDSVPEFEAALRVLKAEEVTPKPVQTRHGWHVIRLNAVAEGVVLPFEAVAPKIAQALEKAAWTRASRDFIATLAAESDIEGSSLDPI